MTILCTALSQVWGIFILAARVCGEVESCLTRSDKGHVILLACQDVRSVLVRTGFPLSNAVCLRCQHQPLDQATRLSS